LADSSTHYGVHHWKLSSVFISVLRPAEVAIFRRYSFCNFTMRLHILRLYVLCMCYAHWSTSHSFSRN
jgi:hypothetical protein